jgi:hypothetical protein
MVKNHLEHKGKTKINLRNRNVAHIFATD